LSTKNYYDNTKNLLISTIPKWVWITVYILVVSVGIFYLRRRWAYDDPFITYRYADNLIHGLGFVYNPGERVLSTTTPLFTLILAGLGSLWNNIPRLANLIGILSIAAGGILFFDLARTLKSPLVGWIGLLLYPSFPLLLNTIGSETPLFLTLGLAAFAFYFRRNYTASAVCSALLILTRPDGILVPILLALEYLSHKPISTIPWKSVAIFLALTIPWFVFSWLYFGSPIPMTLMTKQHQGLMVISNPFAKGFLLVAKGYIRNYYNWIQVGIAVLGFFYFILRARQWFVFLLWAFAHFAAYSFLGVTSYFWYYAPLIPGFLTLIGLGVISLKEMMTYSTNAVNRLKPYANSLSHGIVAFFTLILFFTGYVNIAYHLGKLDSRYSIYRDVGLWLNQNTPEDTTLAMLEAGIIGYYSNRTIVDFAGLIRPSVAGFLSHNTTYEDAALFVVEKFSPSFVVLHQDLYPRLEESYIDDSCDRVKRFIGENYDYKMNIVIYQCDFTR
jgi:hypothetical protein